jgi:hypothetical protein
VEAIRLVGSFIAGCHQELRVNLQSTEKFNCIQSPAFARISRVNGSDTFQLVEAGAQSTASAGLDDLPTLLVLDTFPQTISLQDVKSAFDQTRSIMKRYDQGDCHALSQMIYDLLVPGSFPAELDF